MTAGQRTRRGTGREALLDAALELIGTRGLSAVTVRDIAAAAGTSLGSATYHFVDRDALLREALQRFADTETQRCAAVIDALRKGRAPRESILAELLSQIELGLARPGINQAQLELYLSGAHDPALAAVARTCIESYFNLIEEALRLAGIAPDRCQPLARWIVALADGALLHSAAAGEKPTALPPDFADAVYALAGIDAPS